MTELHFITNSISTAKEVTRNGKGYLVSPVVALRQGVLNEFLILQEEIEKYPQSWENRVTPVDHPQINGIYVSANLLDVIDTEVMGNFHNVQVDGDRLKGEIWIDLERAAKIGVRAMKVVNSLRAGEPVEVSTGYFADVEETVGTFNGKSYTGIHRNIRPDHLALLPDGVGACSWDDGCGTPRVNRQKEEGMGVKANEMTLDDRAMLVRRAFWEQVASVGDIEYFDGDWDVLAVFDDTLIAKDWMSKGHMAFPYTLAEEGGVVTFGEAVPTEVVYRAKEGGAEIVVVNQDAPKANEIGLFARIKRWAMRDKTDSVAVLQQEEKDEVAKKCDLVTALVANKQVKFSKETLDKWSEEDLQTLQASLVVNEEASVPVTPVAETTVTPATVQLPQEVTDFAKMIQGLGGVEALGQALSAITANADSEKSELVADLVANEQCQFDEAELRAMSTTQLQKLAGSLQVRDYSGAAGVLHNSNREQDSVMEMPKAVWAVAGEAK